MNQIRRKRFNLSIKELDEQPEIQSKITNYFVKNEYGNQI